MYLGEVRVKAEEYIEEYLSKNKTPHNDIWKFEDGCALQGLANIYQLTKNSDYKDTIIRLLDRHVDKEGHITYYNKEDYINMGRLLLFLYEQNKEERYKKAASWLADQLKAQPRTSSGNFLYKKEFPNQIWLESLYGFMPFYAEFETKYDEKEQYNDIIAQFKNIRKYLFHSEKGLYSSVYIENAGKEEDIFQLHPIGTFLMALIDTLEFISEETFEHYKAIEGLFKEAVRGVLKYQDEKSRLFYQIVDRPDFENNHLDRSGSAMISYAILKGCRLGALLEEKYKHHGEEILDAIEEDRSYEPKDVGIYILAYSEK